MKKPKLTVAVLLAIAVCVGLVTFSPGGVLASGTTYYLDSQNGNDSNSGSASAPWQTIKKAVSSIHGGDTVILAQGLYNPLQSPFVFGPAGSPGNLTTFKAGPGARVIITQTNDKTPTNMSSADYVRLEGLFIGGIFDPAVQQAFIAGHEGDELIGNTFFGWYGGVLCGWCENLIIQDNRFVNNGANVQSEATYISSGTGANGQQTNHVIIDHNLFLAGTTISGTQTVNVGGGYGFQGWHGALNIIATRNLIAHHMWGTAFDGHDNLIANNFYWNETGTIYLGGALQPWGPLLSLHSVIANNIFGPNGWVNIGNANINYPNLVFLNNAFTNMPFPPGTGGPICKAPCGTGGIVLHQGQELTEIGMTAQDMDATIAALGQAFNQPSATLLTDTTIEPNISKLYGIHIPVSSPLYQTGFFWFGQPVNMGNDAPAPADFWAAFRGLGLTEYDRSGQPINRTSAPDTATPIPTSTNIPPTQASTSPATATSTGIPSNANPIPTYSLTFSTLMGGAGEDSARGVDVDAAGNIYVAGGTASSTFPVTEGASYQNNGSQCGSLGSFGKMDVFVTKFSPGGQLIWSRLIDTPCYARAYAVHVDSSGFVYIAGRAGDHFPTTQGSIQPSFPGSKNNPSPKYGAQSGFVTKLSPDGSQIIWASYFGENDQGFLRDIALDGAGNIFLAESDVTAPNPIVSGSAFQKTLGGGADLVAAEISNDGTNVIWATYFGGSADDGGGPSVRIDNQGEPIYFASTKSTNLPVTANAFQRTFAGTIDGYLVKFTPDGSGLVFSTYIGGSGEESTETHHVALDSHGNALVSMYTNSIDFPTTAGAYQRTLGGGYDFGLAKFSPTGSLLAATYLGGSGAESPQGMSVDSSDNPVLFGSSASTGICASNEDEIIVRLDQNLSQLLDTNCVGGSQLDQARDGVVDTNDNLIAVGWTQSTDFPLVNPIQSTFGGVYDVTVLKVALAAPPSNTPTATATPTRTSTSTPVPPTPTPTYMATATSTAMPPSATPTATATPTDPQPSMITVQENDPTVQYDAWVGVRDQGASGGSYRVSKVANNTARFTFRGTSVQWISQRGPDRGLARVTIDGVTKGIVDLYNPTIQYRWSKVFGALSNRRHTITIRVLGSKNPNAVDTNVVVDALVASGTSVEDDDAAIRFDNWQSGSNVNSNGGTYRVDSTAGSVNRFTFSGTEVEWITAKGPSYGKANVFIDGVRIGGTVDLYAKTQQWQVVISFAGLAAGQHILEVKPLGVKNFASKGKGIVIDAFCANPVSP